MLKRDEMRRCGSAQRSIWRLVLFQARLNAEIGGGAWCPRNVIDLDHTLEEYLEVDLVEDTFITSVVVQGRYANGLGQEYTEFYVLRYWSDRDEDWIEYRNGCIFFKETKNAFIDFQCYCKQKIMITPQ